MILTPVIIAVPRDTPPRSRSHVRQQGISARRALERCAKLCGAPRDGWEKYADDVPLPNAGYYWSVTHKRQWAAAVISDGPVGIDIEHVAPRDRELHDSLADAEEWALLGDRSWPTFFRLWTAKEAALKANGCGISKFAACRLTGAADERHLTLEFQSRTWNVEHYYHADHVTAVACNEENIEWCVIAE